MSSTIFYFIFLAAFTSNSLAEEAKVPPEVEPLMQWMAELRLNSGADGKPVKEIQRSEGQFECRNNHIHHSFACLTKGSTDYFFCTITPIQLSKKAPLGQYDPLVCEGKNWFCRRTYPMGQFECFAREDFARMENYGEDKVTPRKDVANCLNDSELSSFVDKFVPGKDRSSKLNYILRTKTTAPISGEFGIRCRSMNSPAYRARWFNR